MKLVLDKSTRKVIAWGEPPWSNISNLALYDVLEAAYFPVPEKEPTRYFYIDGQFVYDTTPTPQETARNNVIATAQTAVGVKLANLTTAQQKSLIAILLYQAGGVDPATMAVRPLAEWVK